VPKHPEALSRAIRRALHRETFILDAKSLVSRTGWQGYNRTPTSGGHAFQGVQLGWWSRIHTEVLQDLGIKARRPQGGRFGVQTTSIAANHPAEPLYQGIGDLSDRHTDHGGPTKTVDLRDASDNHGILDLQVPRKIWQSSEARLPQKVFNRTKTILLRKQKYRLIGIGPITCRAIAGH
jgi:hypothetical protein